MKKQKDTKKCNKLANFRLLKELPLKTCLDMWPPFNPETPITKTRTI